jgi:E3 ubiquitin-protein ligase UBR7
LIGLPRDWYKGVKKGADENGQTEEEEEETPLPPGFPGEDDFQTFLCYKCVDSNPWLRRYAGTAGFLPPVHKEGGLPKTTETAAETTATDAEQPSTNPKKRKMEDEEETEPDTKRTKEDTGNTSSGARPDPDQKPKEEPQEESTKPSAPKNKHDILPNTAPSGTFSLFMKEDFRDQFCRCRDCYPNLSPHVQLREEEETYEPPMSEDGEANGGGSTGTGSLLDRGEAALSNIDRVRAIEGAMVYNHLRDKVKEFLRPFAETGKAVGAEDIKAYFEKLRGDEQPIRDAASQTSAVSGKDDDHDNDEGDGRKEQSGTYSIP